MTSFDVVSKTFFTTSFRSQPKRTQILLRRTIQRIMSSEGRINNRKGVWRRFAQGLSRSNVSRLWRSFRSVITCGCSEVVKFKVVSNPIYGEPRNTVSLMKPETSDEYLSNEELKAQLNILEMRFTAQTLRLNDSMSLDGRKSRMSRAVDASKQQFDRLEGLVNDIQEMRKVESADGLTALE